MVVSGRCRSLHPLARTAVAVRLPFRDADRAIVARPRPDARGGRLLADSGLVHRCSTGLERNGGNALRTRSMDEFDPAMHSAMNSLSHSLEGP